MEAVCSFIELAATTTEVFIIISIVMTISVPDYSFAKNKSVFLVCWVIDSLYVVCMNSWMIFSFFTPTGTILFLPILLGKLLSDSRYFLRVTACTLAMYIVLTIDYILVIGVGLLSGTPRDTFQELLLPGLPRIILLIADKACDVIAYYLLRKYLSKLARLKNSRLLFMLICSAAVYGIMQYQIYIAVYGNFFQLQGAVMITLFLLLAFISVLFISQLASASLENEKMTNNMLATMNQMMETNYVLMNKGIMDNAKAMHDFHHHLAVIRSLAQKESCQPISDYAHSIYKSSMSMMPLCSSGSDIVDAVINSKAAEAKQKNIDLSYNIQLVDLNAFDPVDICAVLANQMENAFEACEKVIGERKVQVDFSQQGGFVLIKVTNTVKEDPFINNPRLLSTKINSTRTHGLGLKNIQDISRKYSESVKNEFKNGYFVSTALLCTPTKKS